MSFDAQENSASDGQPYFLYKFDNGVATPTFLTSNPTQLTKMAETWLPSPIAHSELETSGNIERSNVDFTFPLTDTFARSLMRASPFITTITIWKGHHNDLAEEHQVEWKGRVIGPKSSNNLLIINAENVFSSMRGMGLRRRYQRTCGHTLYQPGCNLDIEDFYVDAIVTAVTDNGFGLTIPVASASDDGWYKAGVVNFDDILGFVEVHVGNSIRLLTRIPGLDDYVAINGSANVRIARGCTLSRSVCEEKFANHLNFGGWPYFPDKNPFSVSIV